MKRFKFPLQPVVTVRSWREAAAREQFAAATRKHAEAEAQVQAARRRADELEQRLRAGRAGAFRPLEQAAFLEAYQRERAAVKQAEVVQHEARTVRDRAREAWQATRAQLRAVEQLEVRARRAHALAEERAEQGALDEIASMRATRPNPSFSS